MRARNLKPGFFTDGKVVKCEPLARILFQGMWCVADREGRLKDDPFELKLQILPADNCDPESLINQLSDGGLILRYEINDEKYIQINTFLDHQKPHLKEAESTIPAPEMSRKEKNKLDKHRSRQVQAPIQPGLSPEKIPSSLIPSSLNVGSLPNGNSKYWAMFQKIWEIFPPDRKGNKEKAYAAFQKATTRSPPEEIYDGAIRYAASNEARDYPKGLAAWFNDDRWKGSYTVKPESSKTTDSLAALYRAGNRPGNDGGVEPGESRGGSGAIGIPEDPLGGGALPAFLRDATGNRR